MDPVTLADILTSVGSIVTSGISWVGSVATTVTSNPLMLMYAIVPMVGLGIGLFSRMLSVR